MATFAARIIFTPKFLYVNFGLFNNFVNSELRVSNNHLVKTVAMLGRKLFQTHNDSM